MFFHSPIRIAFPVPYRIAGALLLAAIVAISHTALCRGATTFKRITFLPANATITAEVADTDELRQRGLMFRTHLGEDKGMIFYFDRAGYHAFYMYNTRIPLSVIFLDEKFRIVDIQDMGPCLERNASACPVFAPAAACKYAIEVNPEFVRKHGIKAGDKVKIHKE